MFYRNVPVRVGLRPAWGVLLVGTLLLAGCGDPSPDDLNTQIDEGNAASALASINSQLAENPSSPVLNILALKARLLRCAELNCPLSNPDEMHALKGNLARTGDLGMSGIRLENGTMLTTTALFAQAAPLYANLPGQPSPTLALLAVAPEEARPALADGLFGSALSHLRQMEPVPAAHNLLALLALTGLTNTYQSWGGLMGYTLQGNTQQTEAYGIALRSQQGNALPANALRLLPHVVAAKAQGRTMAERLSTLMPYVQNLELPRLLDSKAGTAVAAELNSLRANATWQSAVLRAEGVETAPITTLSGTTALGPAGALHLQLTNLSLAFAPNQPDLWREFLPQAAAYMQTTSATLGGMGVFDNLNPEGLPGDIQADYLGKLFKVIEARVASQQPILQLLQQAGTMKMDRPTATKLEKLVQSGLETALNQRNLDAVLDYAAFKPEIARQNRQAVVPLLVSHLKDLVRESNFERVQELDDLLTNKLKLDFNMGSLLVQEFAAEAANATNRKLFTADTPEVLLQSQASATEPLQPLMGSLWEYLVKQFASKPAVLNGELKKLVNDPNSTYGTPTAMYRLMPYFNTADYPVETQQEFLAAAIQQSVIKDTSLTGPGMMQLTGALAEVHPYMSTAGLVEQALARGKTLEDSQNMWASATPALRETIRTVRPQFALLMSGIDSFTHGDKTFGIRTLSKVKAMPYAGQAEAYLGQYREALSALVGLYAATDATSGLPTAYVKVESPLFHGGTGGAADLRVTFINRLGTLTAKDADNLGEDLAALRSTTLTLPLDVGAGNVVIDPKILAEFPASPGFDALYGAIRGMTFYPGKVGDEKPGALSLESLKGAPAVYEKVAVNPAATDLPEHLPIGRFTLTMPLNKDLSGVSGSITAAMLPAGSLLEITPMMDAALPSSTLAGTLWHPAANKAIEMSGSYDTELYSTLLNYSYPLPSGGLVKARLTCQVLAGPIVCAAHNLHQPRIRNILTVRGLQTRESLENTQANRAAWNSSQLNLLMDAGTSAAQAALASAAAAPVSKTILVVSGTLTSGSVVVSGSSGFISASTLLPPPKLDDGVSATVTKTSAAPKTGTSPAPVAAPAAPSTPPTPATDDAE